MVAVANGNVIADAFVRIRPESTGFDTALRQTVASSLLQTEKQANGFTKRLTASITSTAKIFATSSVTALALVGGTAVQAAGQLQTIERSFAGLFGGIEKGRKEFDKVFALAEKTPFEGGALAKNFQRFVAAFSSQGQSLASSSDRTLKILNSLADGGAALGATTENIDGFALALTQTIGKGKLTGEEVRQFTNNLNGFNVIAAVANHTGKTQAEVYEDMRAGAISADIAIESIVEGLNKIPGAAGASERQLRTMTGALSTVKDVFQRSSFDGLSQALDIFANATVDSVENLREIFKVSAEGVGDIMIVGVDVAQRALRDFDSLFGKFIEGNIQTYVHLLGGASDGLLESFKQFDRLGRFVLRNQPYVYNFGESLGRLSEGFATYFTNVVIGLEPAIQGFVVFSEIVTKSFNTLNTVLNSTGIRAINQYSHTFLSTLLTLREAFRETFDGQDVSSVLRDAFGVTGGIEAIFSTPLRFIRDSADDIAITFKNLVRTIGPDLVTLRGSFVLVADSFRGFLDAINVSDAGEFFVTFVQELIQGFATIAQYGSIGINVLTGFVKILQPLLGGLGDLPERLLAAFTIFKLTNSPLLGLVSLFKDLDTSMLVFFVTLGKVLPIIRQAQAAFNGFKVNGALTGITTMISAIKGVGSTAVTSFGQYIEQARKANLISYATAQQFKKNAEFIKIQSLPFSDASGQKVFTNITKNLKAPRIELDLLNKGMGQFNNVTSKGTRTVNIFGRSLANNVVTNVEKGTGRILTFNSGLTSLINGMSRASLRGEEFGNNFSKAASKGSEAASGATRVTGGLGAALGGVAGIAGSIGLGVGVSLLTAKLADSSAKAAELKGQISETASIVSAFYLASTPEDRSTAFTDFIANIRENLPVASKAGKAFTAALTANGVAIQDYAQAAIQGGKANEEFITSIDNNAVTQLFNGVSGDVFENSSRASGGRNISDKVEKQARAFITKAAELGIDIKEMGRGLNLSDKAVQETLRGVAKQKGLDVEKTLEVINDSRFDDSVRKAELAKLGFGDIFIRDGGAVQFKGDQNELITNLNAMGQAAKAGREEAAESLKQEIANGKVLKDNLAIYKQITEARKAQLSSSGQFFNQLGEANTTENLTKTVNAFKEFKNLNLSNTAFELTQNGRDFIGQFQQLTETESTMISNLSIPIGQQFDMLVKTNTEFDNLAKAAGLTDEQVTQLRVNTGNLTLGEDFGAFVTQLNDSMNNGLLKDPTKIKQIVGKAVTLDEANQKAFIDSIANDALRAEIEKQLKDLKGNVLLTLGEEALDSATSLQDQTIGAKDFGTAFSPNTILGTKNRNDFQILGQGILAQQKEINQAFKDGKISAEEYNTQITATNGILADTFNETTSKTGYSRLLAQQGFGKSFADQARELVSGKNEEDTRLLLDRYLKQFGEQGTGEQLAIRFAVEFDLDPKRAAKDLSKTLSNQMTEDKDNKVYVLMGIDSAQLAQSVKDLNYNAEEIKTKIFPELDGPGERAFLADFAELNPKVAVEVVGKDGTPEEVLSIIPSLDEENLKSLLALIPTETITTIFPDLDATSQASVVKAMTEDQVVKTFPTLTPEGKTAFLAAVQAINPTLAVTLQINDATAAIQKALGAVSSIFKAKPATLTVTPTTTTTQPAQNANGTIASNPLLTWVGEAGAEAIIPMTRPQRALQLLKQSGLYDLAVRNSQNGSSYVQQAPSNNTNTTNNININMQNSTTDPEAMAMFLDARLAGGISR